MGSKRFRKDGFFRGDRYPGRHPSNEYGIHPKKIKPTPPPLNPRNAKIAAINPLKSKIRDLTRVLEHADHLPPGVRIEKERALVGYRMDLENAEEEKRTKEMIGRYHMVRFFGRSTESPVVMGPATIDTHTKSVKKQPATSKKPKSDSHPPNPPPPTTPLPSKTSTSQKSTLTTRNTAP